MLSDLWEKRTGDLKARVQDDASQIRQIEKKIATVVGRTTEAEGPKLISAYENEIKRQQSRRVVLTENLEDMRTPARGFDETFRTTMAFLANPWRI
ncbi:MAG: hypothetical protein AAF409_21410 [Pseudomonadota bacterium]